MTRKFFVTKERKWSGGGKLDIREERDRKGIVMFPLISFTIQAEIRKQLPEEEFPLLTTSNIIEIVDEKKFLLHQIGNKRLEGWIVSI